MFRVLHIALLSLLTLSFSTIVASASFEQKLVSVNAENKHVTLTLFHFNTSSKKPSIVPVVSSVGKTLANKQGIAAISISANSGVSVKNGKIYLTQSAQALLKNSSMQPLQDADTYGKHTFILSNGKDSYSLGYAPFMSKTQLSYALKEYVKSNKLNFHTAILLESGNTCSFYKDNGDYHPYYLKELNPAKQVLMVK